MMMRNPKVWSLTMVVFVSVMSITADAEERGKSIVDASDNDVLEYDKELNSLVPSKTIRQKESARSKQVKRSRWQYDDNTPIEATGSLTARRPAGPFQPVLELQTSDWPPVHQYPDSHQPNAFQEQDIVQMRQLSDSSDPSFHYQSTSQSTKYLNYPTSQFTYDPDYQSSQSASYGTPQSVPDSINNTNSQFLQEFVDNSDSAQFISTPRYGSNPYQFVQTPRYNQDSQSVENSNQIYIPHSNPKLVGYMPLESFRYKSPPRSVSTPPPELIDNPHAQDVYRPILPSEDTQITQPADTQFTHTQPADTQFTHTQPADTQFAEHTNNFIDDEYLYGSSFDPFLGLDINPDDNKL